MFDGAPRLFLCTSYKPGAYVRETAKPCAHRSAGAVPRDRVRSELKVNYSCIGGVSWWADFL